MAGTSRVRVPSGLARSMARPRLMCAGVIRAGLPSWCPNPLFIAGIRARALIRANPTRGVKLTLPPRLRRRWLLMTTRLSMSSLAGTTRTLAAVGGGTPQGLHGVLAERAGRLDGGDVAGLGGRLGRVGGRFAGRRGRGRGGANCRLRGLDGLGFAAGLGAGRRHSGAVAAVVCDLAAVVCDLAAVVCDLAAVVCDLAAVVCDLAAVVCDLAAVAVCAVATGGAVVVREDLPPRLVPRVLVLQVLLVQLVYEPLVGAEGRHGVIDRKSTRLNSSHA